MCLRSEQRETPAAHADQIADVAGEAPAGLRLSADQVARAITMVRAKARRVDIVRATGMTAAQVAELIDIERPTAPPDRCTQTGDLFQCG